MTTITESRREERLRIEEADAWFEYLEKTQVANGAYYDVIEEVEWQVLTAKLQKVERQRSA